MTPGAEGTGHDRCGAKTRAGAPCGRPAGWGTGHPGIGRCKLHGGSTPNHQRAAQLEIARRECDRLGIPIDVDPGTALIGLVREAAGNVEFYRSLVAELPTHPTPGERTSGDGKPVFNQGEPGVYGPHLPSVGRPDR